MCFHDCFQYLLYVYSYSNLCVSNTEGTHCWLSMTTMVTKYASIYIACLVAFPSQKSCDISLLIKSCFAIQSVTLPTDTLIIICLLDIYIYWFLRMYSVDLIFHMMDAVPINCSELHQEMFFYKYVASLVLWNKNCKLHKWGILAETCSYW